MTDPDLTPVRIPTTPDGVDTTLGHPDPNAPARTDKPLSLRAVIDDALDEGLNEQDAGRDVVTDDLARLIERAIVEASGGPHHVVRIQGYSWTIQHPITERFGHPRFESNLFHCTYNTLIADTEFPEDGMYEVWLDGIELRWEPTTR